VSGGSWLSRLDVQPRPLRALLAAFLLVDLRGQTYGQATKTEAGALIPPLYWVIGQFLATSMLLALLLFGRVDAWFFAFANLSATLVLVFAALVVEFHEVVLDPADVDVIGHRPLYPRTYAAARLANLLFYVALMMLATTIFPAILGAALRDSGPSFAVLYVGASVLTALGAAAFVVLLYTALGVGRQLDSARPLFAWLQIIAILVVFYGAQLMLRGAEGNLEHFAARPPDWVRFVPTAWLADVAIGVERGAGNALLLRAGAAVLVVAVLVVAAGVQLTRAWSAVHRGERVWRRVSVAAPSVAGTWIGPVLAQLSSSRHEAVAFRYVRTLMRRDSEIAMRSWPAFGMAIAAVILGWATNQLADPFVERGAGVVLVVALPALLAPCAPALLYNLRFCRDHQAGWLLRSAPLPSFAPFAAGVRKALLVTYFLPVLVALFVALAIAWRNPLHAAIETVLLAIVVVIALITTQPSVGAELPFGRAAARGSTLGPIAPISAMVGAAGMGLGAVQYALGPDLGRQSVLVVLLAVSVVPLARGLERRFAAPPPPERDT
jgi:hypothetical protein